MSLYALPLLTGTPLTSKGDILICIRSCRSEGKCIVCEHTIYHCQIMDVLVFSPMNKFSNYMIMRAIGISQRFKHCKPAACNWKNWFAQLRIFFIYAAIYAEIGQWAPYFELASCNNFPMIMHGIESQHSNSPSGPSSKATIVLASLMTPVSHRHNFIKWSKKINAQRQGHRTPLPATLFSPCLTVGISQSC